MKSLYREIKTTFAAGLVNAYLYPSTPEVETGPLKLRPAWDHRLCLKRKRKKEGRWGAGKKQSLCGGTADDSIYFYVESFADCGTRSEITLPVTLLSPSF